MSRGNPGVVLVHGENWTAEDEQRKREMMEALKEYYTISNRNNKRKGNSDVSY